MPKVYVAAAFRNLLEAKDVMSRLQKIGYEITHDWTNESSEGLKGEELTSYLEKCAEHDFDGVMSADLFFLINDDRGRGAFTELGFALAKGLPIIVAKEKAANNIFLHLQCQGVIWKFETIDQAIEKAERFFSSLQRDQPHVA
jgi:nucleoside 2-deoxyribosyltransferase